MANAIEVVQLKQPEGTDGQTRGFPSGLKPEDIFIPPNGPGLTPLGMSLQRALILKQALLCVYPKGFEISEARRAELEDELKKACAENGIDVSNIPYLGTKFNALVK